MQIRVDPRCSKHQTVRYGNKEYELTRMGFGLNCAPQILKEVVNKVLGMNPEIQQATSAYFDDIIVNEDKVSAVTVAEHLEKFGLPCKPPVKLGEGSILGLKIARTRKGLLWSRQEAVPTAISPSMTKRQLFSLCGRWVGHFPVAGWLRPATSFVKRLCEGTNASWEEAIGDQAACRAQEIKERLEKDDPVKGCWSVRPGTAFTLWCDASTLAMGAVLERDGEAIEDMCWLRKKDTAVHINVAELTAVVCGIALALKWGAKNLVIMTDSASVHWWLSAMLSGERKIRVRGDSEMLVRRRLELIEETLKAYSVQWSVRRVESEKKKADLLTRVPKPWLRPPVTVAIVGPDGTLEMRAAERAHDVAHLGVQATLYFARELLASVTEADADRAVRTCEWCASISPHPVNPGEGTLDVPVVWERLAADVTHLRGDKFLTVIDCRPSRYTVWKQIASDDVASVAGGLEDVFRLFGPPEQIVFDNGLSFRSGVVRQVCDKWEVQIHFRCADRASGNAIVERCHRAVKEIAARRGGNVMDAVVLYNMVPRGKAWKSPAEVMTGRRWRNLMLKQQPERPHGWREVQRGGPFNVGDAVWIKQPKSKCTDLWREGRVSGLNSDKNMEVDGMPRHVKDIRRRSEGWHHKMVRRGVPAGRSSGGGGLVQLIENAGDVSIEDPKVTFSNTTGDDSLPEPNITLAEEEEEETEQAIHEDGNHQEAIHAPEDGESDTHEQNRLRRSSRA